jgi:hypothetical protein
MKRAERELILRQGVVLPETPRERRHRDGLADDLASSPLTGRPLHLRLRNFRPAADGYLVSLGGPLPYMQRLREIDALTDAVSAGLGSAWRDLAAEVADDEEFARRWTETAGRQRFDEHNDLIDRHNRWYPIESRLPMDPRTGDYALVNGRDYRLRRLDADWILERFPPDRRLVSGFSPTPGSPDQSRGPRQVGEP